jgi:hypothetical protein
MSIDIQCIEEASNQNLLVHRKQQGVRAQNGVT